MKSSIISLRLPVDLIERIDNLSENRTEYIKQAIEEKLNPVKMPELTKAEKREVVRDAKSMTDMMRDAIKQRLQQESDLLIDMDRDSFVQLVARLLPKEEVTNADLEQDVLSLRESIAALPGMEDITKELNHVKGELHKVTLERDLNLKLLKHSKDRESLALLMGELYRGVVGYTANLVARNSLPGVGEGGGLTEKGLAEIAEIVRNELEKLDIYRK
jgi:predicted DNA-binding protein